MAKFVIVGFDPASTKNIGWSSIILSKKPSNTAKLFSWNGGTFVMPKTDERWQVLWPMFGAVESFLESVNPNLVIVEKTSSFAGGFITGQVSNCMGVIFAVCGKLKIPVDFVFPTSVKKLVAGHGRAKKSQVKKAVRAHLLAAEIDQVEFDSDHTADAASNIIYWLLKNNVIPPLDEVQNNE